MVNRCCLLLVAGVVSFAGCGRKYPVEEISVGQSGVQVVDREWTSQTDWNGWRGPGNNGIAPDQELVTQWDEETNIRWRSDVPGRGHSSPIVVGDAVYLATAIEDRQQQSVICYDRTDGSERWTQVVHQGGLPSPGENHKKGTNANGTIASDGSRLYVAMFNSDSVIATAIDLEGEIVWQREVGKFVSKFGYAPSPILYKSLVIIASDTRGGGYLAALDTETGQIAWRVSRGNHDSYSSPVVANVGGKDQLLISGCETVSSYDPTTGEQLWETPGTAESTCGTVVTDGQRIFASGGYPDKETVCLSASSERIWSNRDKLYEPSLLVADGRLYAFKDDGIAICWSAESGDVLWKKRLGGNFSASPILSGENLYVSNLEGDTFVIRAGDKYELVSANRLGDDCYASPAVSDGDLFLRIGVGAERSRQEQLVCIGTEE